jgi:hypothetical protein
LDTEVDVMDDNHVNNVKIDLFDKYFDLTNCRLYSCKHKRKKQYQTLILTLGKNKIASYHLLMELVDL